MNYCGLLLSVVLPWCQLSADTRDAFEFSDEAATAAVRGINTFSKSIYEVLSNEPGNVVVSPFSVEVVVAMLLLGLEGDTVTQVSAALHLPEERSKVAEGFKILFKSLQHIDDGSLEIVNKIYIQKEFDIKHNYTKSTKENFHTAAEGVDFRRETEKVRLAVNGWTSEETHGKIKDFLAPGTLTPDDVMILLNAIYFKGLWRTGFKMEETRDQVFHLSSNSSKNVPMMHLTTDLLYTNLHDNLQVLLLPYKGERHSMLIFLPNSPDALQELESNFKELDVTFIRNSMRFRNVEVTLPRFKILQTTDLKSPLEKLGMSLLFNGEGTFIGVTDGAVYVSKVLQKALVEVNEEGTDPSALTALFADETISLSAAHLPIVRFTADHPFIYMIVEEANGTILFVGRVSEPKETA